MSAILLYIPIFRLEAIHKILNVLDKKYKDEPEGYEISASDLFLATGLQQTTCFHNCKKLLKVRLIKVRKEGLYRFYSIDPIEYQKYTKALEHFLETVDPDQKNG